MKHLPVAFIATTFALGTLSAVASAQPNYQPPTAPPAARSGLTLGADFGIGSMSSEGPIRCDGCDFSPAAFGGSIELGAMLNPRLAVMAHLRLAARPLDADGVELLYNGMFLGVAKFWITPQLWIKGGLGVATLGISYDDGFVADDAQLDEGVGGLLAVGFEILHAPRFAIDLALTGTSSAFDGLDDTISTGLVSIGASWF